MRIVEWNKNLTYKDWKEERKKISGIGEAYCRVGASDIATLTGSNRWKSKRRLFLSMIGYHDREFRNNSTLTGQEMEPKIAERFERYNLDEEVYFDNRQFNTPERLLKKAEFFVLNDEYPNLSASLDFIPANEECFSPFTGEIYAPYTPFEAKYIQDFVYREWDGVIPMHYYEQMQVQLALTETDLGVFMPLLHSGDFHPVEVERSDSMIEYLDYLSREFAIEVTKGKILKEKIDASETPEERHELELELETLVPIDTLPDEVALSNELMTSGNEVKIVADGSEEEEWIEEYVQANEKIKELEGVKAQSRSKLIHSADGYSGIETNLYKAIIRGDNAGKKSYFRITIKK